MDWGHPSHLRALLKMQEKFDRQGEGQVVKTLALLPDFPEDFTDHWNAFLRLHRSRQAGINDVDPISNTEMEAWFNNNSIPIPERPEFSYVIEELDREWRSYNDEKRQARLDE